MNFDQTQTVVVCRIKKERERKKEKDSKKKKRRAKPLQSKVKRKSREGNLFQLLQPSLIDNMLNTPFTGPRFGRLHFTGSGIN